LRLGRRRRARVHVARGTELERDPLVADVGREEPEARHGAVLDAHVLDQPDTMTDAVRATDLERLPDGTRSEAFSGVDRDREVLAVADLERLEVLLRGVTGLLAGDVEADDATIAI